MKRACVLLAPMLACTTGGSIDTHVDASQPQADAIAADAACPIGAGLDLDSQIAVDCANRGLGVGGQPLNVWVSASPQPQCGGDLVLIEQDGVDTATVYLYDPVTKHNVEVISGPNGGQCTTSVDGNVTPCFFVGYGPTPTGFVDACPDDAGSADAGDAGPADAGADG
jgi:hypothetical protein